MKRVIIQLWQTDFNNLELAATPFLMAATAAAMDMDVEIHATGQSVNFFLNDQPLLDQVLASSNRPLRDYIDEAIRCGAKICLCSMALRDREIDQAQLRDGAVVVGLVTMLERATASDTTVLTY